MEDNTHSQTNLIKESQYSLVCAHGIHDCDKGLNEQDGSAEISGVIFCNGFHVTPPTEPIRWLRPSALEPGHVSLQTIHPSPPITSRHCDRALCNIS